MTISVMIVDDEAIITDGLAQMIQSFELPIESVKKFYASPTALDYLKVNAVDIVITDINMPVLNGIELIKAINQVAPTTQIIVLTGFGTLDYATEAMRYGVRYFLQKPTQPEQLKQAIQKSIQFLQESTEN
ncbi:response regulator [Agrilactobacillus fermenti]|uniref:response regulator n=1 Tax=Agrilactobacillus fermenti TaxID=2586909 RepID=UPI001E4B5810|nr:response regulator [Agrilactobacillus fermenti]MCD2256055.1 response regulator [Agrilactobacillus fermenti]